MRYRITHPNRIAAAVLIGCGFSLGVCPQWARADLSSLDLNKCKDTCAAYMRNPDGSMSYTTWGEGSKSHELCNALGINTSSNPTRTFGSQTSVNISDGNGGTLCKIPANVQAGLTAFAGETVDSKSDGSLQCDWAAKMQRACKQHLDPNSPLLNACQAYIAITGNPDDATTKCMEDASGAYNGVSKDLARSDARANLTSDTSKCSGNSANINNMSIKTNEELLLGLDMGAAVICLGGCMGSPAAAAWCGVAAMAESAFELETTIQMKSTATAAYIQMGLAGLGGLGGAGAFVTGLKDNSNAKVAAKEGVKEGVEKEAEKKLVKNKASCVTAVAMTALAGIRTYNLIQIDKSAETACSSVLGLTSSGTPPTQPSQGPLYGNLSGGGTVGSSGGGSGEGSGEGGNTGTLASGSDSNPVDNCMTQQIGNGSTQQAAGSICASQKNLSALGATAGSDGALLNQMGPGNILGNLPASLHDIAEKAKSQGAGAALSSMLPSSAGDMGSALAGLAQAAQSDGANLGGSLGMSNSTYASGGGGGSKGGSSSDSSLSSLFSGGGAGAFGGGGGAQGPKLASYGSVASHTDIWHANTRSTLFEIVSDKIMKVSNRVH